MSERQRHQEEVDGLQKRWGALGELLSRLQQEHDVETRADERYRLESRIKEQQGERQKVEAELGLKEEELRKSTKQELIFEARQRERKGAYTEALRVWQEIRQLDPIDSQSEQEIQRLTEKQHSAERLDGLIRRLVPRNGEIKPIFPQVVQRLRNPTDGNLGNSALLVSLVED
jgi:hypothetical protein